MIETDKLRYAYPGGTRFVFPDFRLEKGNHSLIRGNSGSGKTTLLHLLSGILKPESGSVIINGTSVHELTIQAKDRFRGRNIGMIFQKHFFIDALTMEENLLLAQSLPGNLPDRSFTAALMEELNISSLSSRCPSTLSQGELQRFSVARALVNKPAVILADEPTSSLDDHNCIRFVRLLQDAAGKHGTTLLIATHDQRLSNEFSNVIDL